MSGLGRTCSDLKPLDELLVPIPFGLASPPSHAAYYALEVHEPELVPPPNKRHRPVPLPLPFTHILSSDHPIATRRLWNVLSGIDRLHMDLQHLEGTHLDPTWHMQPATHPSLTFFTIQIEADDPEVDGTFFVARGAGPFRGVRVHDVLDTVQRECAFRTGHLARGVAQELWWGGLRPGPQESISLLTLHGESPRLNSQSLYPTSAFCGYSRL